jgi:phospholipid/cholesterol/gamma-HCH transport system substrate-binding protein
MSNENRGTEWKVGLFIAIGLMIVTVMAIKFGKLGSGLKKFYIVHAEFPDASGFLKGGEVKMAGAPIGFAEEAPTLVEDRYAVTVPLRIRDGVKIPKNATFTIESSGLMGDSFVAVALPKEPVAEILSSGDKVVGVRTQSLSDLTAKGGDVMLELKKRLEELEAPIKDVRDRLLSDVNLSNLQQSFANIRDFTDSLKKTGKDLDDVVSKAKAAGADLSEAMASAKVAVGKVDAVVAKVDAAAAELKPALAGLGDTVDGVEKAVTSLRTLINKANQGHGALGLLLSDRETADNLKAFIRNIKTRGILFYKDKP